MKIWLRIAAALAVLAMLIAGTGLWIAQSDWLRDRIRAEIVGQVETATGGKVELQAFHLDWRTLEARIDRFVIHGTEPPASAPLLQLDSATVQLRILSLLRHDFQIDHVEVEHPQAHVIVYPGGRTNLPQPRRRSSRSPIGTILDLKIGKFDLRNGTFSVESPGDPPKVMPWEAQGRNLAAQIDYDAANSRYSGKISIAPLRVMSLDLELAADAALERNRVIVSHATVKTSDSELTLTNAILNDFTHPLSTTQFSAHVSLPEAVRLLKLPVKQSGTMDLAGAARYTSNADYKVDGSAHGAGVSLTAFEATPARLVLTGIHANALGGSITANAELRDYKTFTAKGRIDRFDLRQTARLETSRPLPYDGLVSGPFEVMGRLDSLKPDVHAVLDIAPAGTGPAARGQVTVHYDAEKSTVELGQSWIQLPNSRVDASGTLGQRLTVKADSQDINDLLPAIDLIPDFKLPAIAFGSASFNGAVTGPINDPKIAGHATADGFTYNGQKIDSMAGDVTVSSSGAAASNAVVRYADLRGQGTGSIQLTNWKVSDASAIAASVDVKNADISKLLAMAGHKEVEFSGTLSTSAQIAGTLANPMANADLTLTKGAIYAQPFDSITARLQSADRATQTLTGLFVSGPKRVNISGRFEHAGTMFPAGTLDFNLTSNTMPLNQIALVRARQPDIHGFGKFHADGAIRIDHDLKHQIQFSLLKMNADASANSLELVGRNLGDARFIAQTQNGVLQASFDSNAAKAVIHGDGTVKTEWRLSRKRQNQLHQSRPQRPGRHGGNGRPGERP